MVWTKKFLGLCPQTPFFLPYPQGHGPKRFSQLELPLPIKTEATRIHRLWPKFTMEQACNWRRCLGRQILLVQSLEGQTTYFLLIIMSGGVQTIQSFSFGALPPCAPLQVHACYGSHIYFITFYFQVSVFFGFNSFSSVKSVFIKFILFEENHQ